MATWPGSISRSHLRNDASLEFGCRWLDLGDTSGERGTLFRCDVLMQGLVVGFAYRY